VSIGYVWLAVLAVLLSLVGAFYYLRVVKLMYFDDASESEPMQVGLDSRILISLNGIAVLVLGMMPGAFLAICERAISLSLGVAI
jgi:NADH-quinone oxidoreductase subunit N